MKHTNRGISLISLIITMLIIAILAAVMIPSGVDKINSAKLTTFNNNITTLKQESDVYTMQNDDYPVKSDGSGSPIVYSITANSALVAETTKKGDQNDTFYIVDLEKLKLDNKDLGVGKTIDDYYILAKTSGNIYYANGVKVGNATYYTKQNKGDGVIAIVPTSAPASNGEFDGSVNSPKLTAGMTAIKWDGSAWINADTSNTNKDWYDYSKPTNKWANIKLADGSMLVWIPRYTYKILNNEHNQIAGDIDIKFSNGTNDDTSNGYRIHPAFYWGGWNIPPNAAMSKQTGGIELKGIWVGKFEISAANGLQDASGDRIAIKPNVSSWRKLKIGDMFNKCNEMQSLNSSVYGLEPKKTAVDVHMLKNSEWAAVAYLSKYARGTTEVEVNDDTNYIGGKGDYVSFKGLSTTGTEYGIYDMSGSAWEYLACYINNNHGYLNSYGSSIVAADAKYKDVFPVAATDNNVNNYNLTNNAYGHGFWETSTSGTGSTGWFEDYSYFMELGGPFVERGGHYSFGKNSGMFYFNDAHGAPDPWGTWRVSLVVQ